MTDFQSGHFARPSRSGSFSSTTSIYTSPLNLSSSPPSTTSTTSTSEGHNGRKEKRQPSITPRKFKRFFTPRSSRNPMTSSSARVFSDITRSINNRNGVRSNPLRPSSNNFIYGDGSPFISRDMKRRKLLHSPKSSPEPSIMDKNSQIRALSPSADQDLIPDTDSPSPSASLASSYTVTGTMPDHRKQECTIGDVVDSRVRAIRTLPDQGIAGQLLQLNFGSRQMLGPRSIIADLGKLHTSSK